MPRFTLADITRLMSVLQIGKSNTLSSDDLTRLLGLQRMRTNEDLRGLVSFAIDQGELIGSNNNGYWILDSVAEIDEVLDSLERRAQGVCDRRNQLLSSWNANNPANTSTAVQMDVKP